MNPEPIPASSADPEAVQRRSTSTHASRPIGSDLGAPTAARMPSSGLTLLLVGALVIRLSQLIVSRGGPSSHWDSILAFVLPWLALPLALLWWWLAPATALRVLPLVVGVTSVLAAALWIPSLSDTVGQTVFNGLIVLANAGIAIVLAVLLITAATLAAEGRPIAAGATVAVLGLGSLVTTPVLAITLALSVPTFLAPTVLLIGGLLVGAGGVLVSTRHVAEVRGTIGVVAIIAAVATVLPNVATFVAVRSDGGFRQSIGLTAWIGGAMLVVAVVGAVVAGGVRALQLVIGAGLTIGSLVGLTGLVTGGLGREWWVLLVIAAVIVLAVALAVLPLARQISMTTTVVTAVVLVASYLTAEYGHLDQGLEIFLTVAGLLAGGIAGATVVGAAVPRIALQDELVVVVLLVLVFSTGFARVFAAAAAGTQLSAHDALPWLAGGLVVAALVVAFWPRSTVRRQDDPEARPAVTAAV